MMSRRKIWYRVDIRETFNLQHSCLFSNPDWSEGCRAVSAADRPAIVLSYNVSTPEELCLGSGQQQPPNLGLIIAEEWPGNIVAETLYPWDGGDPWSPIRGIR